MIERRSAAFGVQPTRSGAGFLLEGVNARSNGWSTVAPVRIFAHGVPRFSLLVHARLLYCCGMSAQNAGSFRLFRFAGIDVFLHWSWLLVAAFLLSTRKHAYSTPAWNIAEYLALFLIVLLHEFGHALACRQVGGVANRIVLWPLGGVAFVSPPPRPGPILWSLVAGPLVNAVLIPVLMLVGVLLRQSGVATAGSDLATWLWMVSAINLVLLVFNLLPIYPLDGGQILRSLLWFALGARRSLLIASGVGLIGVAALIVLAVLRRSVWTGIIALYLGTNCWNAFVEARRSASPHTDPPAAAGQ
jgi:Zn-dependent protease